MNKCTSILQCLLLTLVTLITASKSSAQKNTLHLGLDSLVPRSLSKELYVDSLRSTIMGMLRRGQFFERKSLLTALEHYRNIVWNDKKFLDAKMDYFIMLGSNAGSQYKTGEAVYYFEQLEQLRKTHHLNGKHQFVTMQKCYLYANSGQYAKVINEYEQQKTELAVMPQKIATGKLNDKMEVFTVLSILKEVGFSYAMLKDTSGLQALILYKDALIEALLSQQKFDLITGEYLQVQFIKLSINYFYYRRLLKDSTKVLNTLHQLYKIINDPTLEQNRNLGLIASCESWLTEYYIFMRPNADSARFYLDRYKNSLPSILLSQKQSTIGVYDFQIWALNSKNPQMIPLLESILANKDSTYNLLAQELDQNLYAQTKAEYTALELERAGKEKKKLNLLLGAIVLLMLLTAIILYQRIKTKSRKVQLHIATMNNVANLKIAALEEEKHQAVKEEQERIAQELHDDFSSMIAAAKSQADVLKLEVGDTNAAIRLNKLSEQIQHIYEASRNKSHEWFYDARLKQQAAFTESLNLILDSALPMPKYKKNVQIDNDAVAVLSIDDRIALLKILQEAIVNIIKHSKADEVSIFLFRNERELIFEVGDNGKGIQANKIAGMGLESMKKRAMSINGQLDITIDDGVVLSVRIPVIQ